MIPTKLIQKGLFWTKGIMLVTGCTKVSEGCAHCWSEKAHAIRCNNPAVEGIYSKALLDDGRFNGKVQFNLRLLEQAARAKKPQVIAIWNDLYHEGLAWYKNLNTAFHIMASYPRHTFLIVTKRPERAVAYLNWPSSVYNGVLSDWPDNIWHIVTAENQERADKRIPPLLRIPGKRGIIIEPMLGEINLTVSMCADTCERQRAGFLTWAQAVNPGNFIHQVILGGETGTGARPMHPDWARSVRDQCQAAGVPFFFKSWGEWRPMELEETTKHADDICRGVKYVSNDPARRPIAAGLMLEHQLESMLTEKPYTWQCPMVSNNKDKNRLLDGKEHNALAWNGE